MKLSAGFFTRLSVGLAATAQIAAALENDGKLDKSELIGILTTVTTGLALVVPVDLRHGRRGVRRWDGCHQVRPPEACFTRHTPAVSALNVRQTSAPGKPGDIAGMLTASSDWPLSCIRPLGRPIR